MHKKGLKKTPKESKGRTRRGTKNKLVMGLKSTKFKEFETF